MSHPKLLSGLLTSCFFLTSLSYAEGLLKKHNDRPLQAETDLSALETWETPIAAFFIRSHHEVPTVDYENWQLVIDGLVENPLRLNLKDLKQFPEKSLHAVLECSGNYRGLQRPTAAGVQWGEGAVGNGEWSGVGLKTILEKAHIKPEAKFARVEGADRPAFPTVPEFFRSIPVEKLLMENTLLAWKMNREVMPVLHGGPLRLILPDWYGQNWIKWLTHITFMRDEYQGFYMKKAYRMPKTPLKPGTAWDSSTGDPIQTLRVQSIIVHPTNLESINPGEFTLSGKAFSGNGAITKVEYSIDEGKHWESAKVEALHPDGGWQGFHAKVSVKKLGKITFVTRATDAKGNTQPLEAAWNPGGYLRNSVDRRTVMVTKETLPPKDGLSLMRDRCLSCHTQAMIESQRISEDAWSKTIKKMEGFGAHVTPEENKLLLKYLSQYSDKLPTASPPTTDYAIESEMVEPKEKIEGRIARGAELYTSTCATCHGQNAEGKTGPRLRGKLVRASVFWSLVVQGKNSMPAFGETLSIQDIADLRSYLKQPLPIP